MRARDITARLRGWKFRSTIWENVLAQREKIVEPLRAMGVHLLSARACRLSYGQSE
jgi:hypothetical protein